MVFFQRVDEDLGCASYLIGDETSGEAVVVDPAYAIEPYLAEAERLGVRLVRVLETHTHADHVSGHGRLALEHGLPVGIHALAEPEYPFDPLEDGDELQVGEITIRVIHTPGHRPEHCCFLADGHLFTGDSLLIGDAARPDLAVEAREGAEGLYGSLQRLVELPESTEVDPGHVAGSLCATGISEAHSSTIGWELKTNRALSYPDLQEFVAATSTVSAPRPPTVERVVALNRGPFLGASPPLEPLEAFDGQVLDVRPPHEFAAGHVPGALNVPVSGSSLGTKAGFLLDVDGPVAIHASSREDASEAAARLRAVGLLDLAGFLTAPAATEQMEPIGVEELERLVAEHAVEVVDVREKNERDDGYIPDSRNIPYRLVGEYADELANGKPVVTVCESGARAGVAASVLAAHGIEARPLLDGGVPDWQARGNAVTKFRRCGT